MATPILVLFSIASALVLAASYVVNVPAAITAVAAFIFFAVSVGVGALAFLDSRRSGGGLVKSLLRSVRVALGWIIGLLP
jgi:hypothetical protein